MADVSSGEPCTHICMDAARALVEEGNGFYTSGDVVKGLQSMTDAINYAGKATEQAIQSKKKQKQTEIALRKLEKRMLDIKETLNFEDKPAVLELADRIDKLRVRILASMFDLEPPTEAIPPPKENK